MLIKAATENVKAKLCRRGAEQFLCRASGDGAFDGRPLDERNDGGGQQTQSERCAWNASDR